MKGGISFAGGVMAAMRSAATQAHHSIPQFLGGAAKQELVDLPQKVHSELHSVLAQGLKGQGLPLPVGGANGSRQRWENYMLSNPGTQDKAFDAVLDASRKIDQTHGTEVTQSVWRNIMDGNFRSLP